MARLMASYHVAHLTEDSRRATVWKVVAQHLAATVPPDAHVLELGSGYCDWINNVHAARRVAVDLWNQLPKCAAPGVETMTLDVREAMRSLGEGSFDVVLASNLLEHFSPDDAASVVGDVARLLRPGGRFVLIQPNFRYAWRHYFDDYTHRAIFTDVSLPALLRAGGFRIMEVRPRFVPYSLRRSRIPIASWMVKAYLLSPVKPAAGQMLVIAQKEPAHVR
jgi:cyclopropane fatty-acyl-phospholipid synthase-like methyltransferase